MTRTLYLLAALVLAPTALAQSYAIDKSSYVFGGTARFASQGTTISFDDFGEEDSDRLTEIAYSVSFGYFVVPGLALGADSQYQRFSQDGVSQTSTSVGPNLSYYFGTAASKAYPFVTGAVGFSTLRIQNRESEGSSNGFRFGAAGGLSYLIARNVALTGAVFYQNESFSDDGASITNDAFGFQGGVTAFIF